jgi:tetratricopeptide (TPR) repeat protein
MKARFAIILCVILFVFAGSLYADKENSLREFFYHGNICYSDNNLKAAISSYKKALDSGYESGPLFYNLGNAYFKNGELGNAIICYLRASRITPNDPDIRSNLAHARSLIEGGVVSLRRPWFIRFFVKAADLLSINRAAAISISFYLLLCIAVIIAVCLKRFRRMFTILSIIISILLAASVLIFAAKFKAEVIQKNAIVIKQETHSKFEPLGNATTFFTLYEGEMVQVIAPNGDWLKIRRLDGKQGWVKKSDIDLL